MNFEMKGSSVSAGDGCRPAPFTPVQWQELEHQALIYKYMVAGIPVPTDLVVPIRRSLEALSARIFQHSSLGYCSYYGKKFDPEPGRCRRTDGKKWRCSKDAHPDSKYCERHMHRGRNRSRKHVESQSTSQSASSAASHLATVSSSDGGCYQSVGSGSFQNLPLYSTVANSENMEFGGNVPTFQVDINPYGISNKEIRSSYGATTDSDDQNYSFEIDDSWRLLPPQVSTSSFPKERNDLYNLQDNTSQLNRAQIYEPTRQQHCFFGREMGSSAAAKQEYPMRSFFDEWPKTRDS